MKKTIIILLSVLLAMSFLASCSSGMRSDSSYNTGSGSSGGGGSGGSTPPMMAPSMPDYEYAGDTGNSWGENDLGDLASVIGGIMPINSSFGNEGLAEKIIYTVSAEIETLNFDETIRGVYSLLALNNAFVENSYVGGRNYAASRYEWQVFRSANFTLRVPKDRLNAITESLGSLGNITSLRSDADNITAQFTDTQSRLSTLVVQEERLLEMLRRAEDVADMIALEERLSQVRYQIESITATLRNWQNQIDYSTLYLNISEVEIYTEIVPVQQRTYWQQIGDGLLDTTRGVGDFFTGLFRGLVISLPVLIILAAIIVAIVFIVKSRFKKRRNRSKSIQRDDNDPMM